jgi:ketosteroid isomerase-like protein
MRKAPFLLMAVICLASLGCSTPAPQSFDAQGVEAVIRDFNGALQANEFDSASALLASDARWIEAGRPVPAADLIDLFRTLGSLGFGLQYEVSDFSVHGQGDFGWATWASEGSYTVSSAEGKDLVRTYLAAGWPFAVDSSSVEWRAAVLSIESAVLQRQNGAWKIVLGHTTDLPPEP